MAKVIQPRLLKGFRDFLPGAERERQRIKQILGDTFASFGFEPIDTPILEYTEILLGKGGGETDKQIYRFEDQGGRDVAMRYDLTVPFARFMALHYHELSLPFKRFHIAKVFRGENTQRGRYREFMQCDFDIVGTDSASADFEVVMLTERSLRAIGVEEVSIHLSHKGVLNSLLAELGLADRGGQLLRTVDKIRKIGESNVRVQLEEIAGPEAAGKVLEYITCGHDNESTLESMRRLAPNAEQDIHRLGEVLDAAREVGIANRIVIDPSIIRGLDYYTGMVFETFLTRLPEIGSVCGGGRYDNLASLYTSEHIPGVGASIGLDRTMAGLEALSVAGTQAGGADALVICSDKVTMARYHAIADELRGTGLRIDVFPEFRNPGQQYAFAEKKGIAAAVIAVEGVETVTVRNLRSRIDSGILTVGDAARLIRDMADARASS